MRFDLTTFMLELVNFLVLAWILTRFVYRPIATAIQSRRDEIASTREQAAAKLAEVAQRETALAQRNRELDQLRETVFAEATTEAAAERARLLAQARDDAAAERERVAGMLEAERDAAVAWVREEAVKRGSEVAGRLLLELAPDAAHRALLDRLLVEVRERGDALRDPSGGSVEVELSMARMPLPGEVDEVRDALTGALGERPRLTVHEDERLGAGAVLKVGDRVLDASVAGQLAVVRDLARQQLEARP